MNVLHGLRGLALGCVAALALAVAPPAPAQGTSQQLPDPVSATDLTVLMARYVQPNRAQSAAIDALHLAYRARFRELRDGDMERFVEQTMNQADGQMPTQEKMDKLLKDWERILKQITDLDDSLFESIAQALGEASRPGVMRARDARARECADTANYREMLFNEPTVDLSALLLDCDLDAAQQAAVNATLIPYEQRLTVMTKDMQSQVIRMSRDLYTELEKAGFGDISADSPPDMAKYQAMMEAYQEILAKLGARAQAKAREMSDLNRKTYQVLHAQLSGDSQRAFRRKFVTAAYPQLAGDASEAERYFQVASRMKTLSPEIKEQVRQAHATWQAADDALVVECMKAIDESRASARPLDMAMNAMGQDDEDRKSKSEALLEKRSELEESAMQQITAALGQKAHMVMSRHFAGSASHVAAGGAVPPELDPTLDEEEQLAAQATAMDTAMDAPPAPTDNMSPYYDVMAQYDTKPISQALADAVVTCLALDADRALIAKSVHDDYVKRWEAEVGPLTERVRQAQEHEWEGMAAAYGGMDDEAPESADDGAGNGGGNDDGNGDGSGGAGVIAPPPVVNYPQIKLDAQAMKATAEARKAKIAKAAELDAAYFSDLANALGAESAPALQMLRVERVLESEQAPINPWDPTGMGWGAGESKVNIAALIRELELPANDYAKAAKAVSAHADQLAKLATDAMVEEVDSEVAMRLWSTQNMGDIMNQSGGGAPDANAGLRIQREMAALQARTMELESSRSDTLKKAWKDALETMDEAQRKRATELHEVKAHPAIFKDARAAQPLIDKSFTLPDLTDDQRTQLTALKDRHRTEHIEACRQLVPTAGPERPTDPSQYMEYWREEWKRTSKRERLAFERDERSQRAVNELRRLLTDEQIKRVSGLRTYERRVTGESANPWAQMMME